MKLTIPKKHEAQSALERSCTKGAISMKRQADFCILFCPAVFQKMENRNKRK